MPSKDRGSFKIAGRRVGEGADCLVIGEVAQAHDGSLGLAHAFIDAIADAGADGVKFQTHIASAESTPSEPFRVRFTQQDATRFDYWRRMEFSEQGWHGLAQHAAERDLLFLSSPFSTEAVELLERVGVPAWKIASGEVANTPMFERISNTRLPVLLSTGMSPWSEIDQAVRRVRAADLPLLVFQCTSSYPCPPEKVGLNVLQELESRYSCPVGLSDHSGTIFPGVAAALQGVDMVEVHVTLSREMFGPDVVASVTTDELRDLIAGIRFVERMRSSEVDKDALALEMTPLREAFTKSVVAAVAIPQGTTLERQHLAAKKPGTGIPAERLESILGRRVVRALSKDELLQEEDLE